VRRVFREYTSVSGGYIHERVRGLKGESER